MAFFTGLQLYIILCMCMHSHGVISSILILRLHLCFRIIDRRGLFSPVDNFSLFSQCIHSKKLYKKLMRGSMSPTIVGEAGAPLDPRLAPPLLESNSCRRGRSPSRPTIGSGTGVETKTTTRWHRRCPIEDDLVVVSKTETLMYICMSIDI